MKYKLGILIFIFSLVLSACSNLMVSKSKINLISGVWKTEKAEGNFKKDSELLKTALEEARNTIYVFYENMTAEIHVRNIINKTTWELDNEWLILKRENETMKFRILELAKEKMVLVGDYSGREMKFTLAKIKN